MHSPGVDGDVDNQLLSLPKRDILVKSGFFLELDVGWVRTFCWGPNHCCAGVQLLDCKLIPILHPTLTGKAFPQNLNEAS
jgi:hypothetical protein